MCGRSSIATAASRIFRNTEILVARGELNSVDAWLRLGQFLKLTPTIDRDGMDEFTVGGVLRDAARLVRRHFILLIGFALVFIALPKLLAAGVAQWLVLAGHPAWGSLPEGLSLFGSTVLAISVVRTAADSADHRTPRFAEGLATSLRLFLPVLGVSLVLWIGVVLGSILLLIPGVMLACRWIVAIPVQAVEHPGVLASLSRSAELTHGVRWRIFGLVLVWALIGFVGSAVVLGLLGVAARSALVPGQVNWLLVGAGALASTVIGLFNNVLLVSIYLALRRTREGALSGDLVAAFD